MAVDIIVRRATARDIDAMAHLWEQLVAYHSTLDSALPVAAPQGALRYGRRLIDRLDDPTARLLVAEIDQRVVGYVLGVLVEMTPEMFAGEPSGFLADIFVDEGYRRRGVGKALVVALSAWFKQRGLKYFEWHVAARNPEAIAFWESLGGRSIMIRMRAET